MEIKKALLGPGDHAPLTPIEKKNHVAMMFLIILDSCGFYLMGGAS